MYAKIIPLCFGMNLLRALAMAATRPPYWPTKRAHSLIRSYHATSASSSDLLSLNVAKSTVRGRRQTPLMPLGSNADAPIALLFSLRFPRQSVSLPPAASIIRPDNKVYCCVCFILTSLAWGGGSEQMPPSSAAFFASALLSLACAVRVCGRES